MNATMVYELRCCCFVSQLQLRPYRNSTKSAGF
ncbi:hypothetical protein HNR53_002104 [Bacillus benzoevorans]|uniref:Uncharacterized protein n=1 Tax=Bacillus benzoevorans TaxID=1456 RepID=A0A7X0HRA1_9BACI|nr:hypothetical protein [Bacillus benzoevorans]